DEIAGEINDRGEAVVFLGDGVPVYEQRLRELLRVPFEFAPAYCNRQRAAAVATLGLQYMAEGKTVPAALHKPDYLRLSQAEREKLEKEKTEKGEEIDNLS
ncbi:MAG: tRNA (adenosine(37)-N6)-threonylcarbamoyltransferase complex dimerization subunit type 1 TsaB, partial [Lachnospiraceae bacterium]|nr:tRNA (adenosine(37)-N6)-threonylcarbamoyltransferase complex dimerization subunit type 1 TsaB [Lachnospiraceae bacterium]